MADFHSSSKDRLFKAVLNLNSIEECYAFFEDLMTIRELDDMAQRLDTAVLLSSGVSYQVISKEVGVSTATISRVNRCLQYGTGGYRQALMRLKQEESEAGMAPAENEN